MAFGVVRAESAAAADAAAAGAGAAVVAEEAVGPAGGAVDWTQTHRRWIALARPPPLGLYRSGNRTCHSL